MKKNKKIQKKVQKKLDFVKIEEYNSVSFRFGNNILLLYFTTMTNEITLRQAIEKQNEYILSEYNGSSPLNIYSNVLSKITELLQLDGLKAIEFRDKNNVYVYGSKYGYNKSTNKLLEFKMVKKFKPTPSGRDKYLYVYKVVLDDYYSDLLDIKMSDLSSRISLEAKEQVEEKKRDEEAALNEAKDLLSKHNLTYEELEQISWKIRKLSYDNQTKLKS